MAVAVTLAVSPAAPAHGATVTAVYTVTGNAGTPGGAATISGSANIGGTAYAVTTTVTMPATGQPLVDEEGRRMSDQGAR